MYFFFFHGNLQATACLPTWGEASEELASWLRISLPSSYPATVWLVYQPPLYLIPGSISQKTGCSEPRGTFVLLNLSRPLAQSR